MRFATFTIAAMSAVVAVSGVAVPAVELDVRQLGSCELTTCVSSLTTIITGLTSSGTMAVPLTCVTSLLSINPTTILADCATVLLASGSVVPAACTACVPVGSLPAGL